MSQSMIQQEYFAVLELIKDYEKRLLTVKGWGVTLSLAALAWGFKDHKMGMFLVASISGLIFWIIEGVMKRHQMRFYQRMREIEVAFYNYNRQADELLNAPLIDWSWTQAKLYFKSRSSEVPTEPAIISAKPSYDMTWFLPHIFLPHAITVISGLVFCYLATHNCMGYLWKW
jgi:hypothetical protein